MSCDPDPNSEEGEKLSLLCALIEDYEKRAFPKTLPNPVDAIKFRMEQAGLMFQPTWFLLLKLQSRVCGNSFRQTSTYS